MTTGTQIPETFQAARPLLRPRALGLIPQQIRAQQLALYGADAGINAVQPLVGEYGIGVILDLPESDVPVTHAMLATWGVTLDEAITAAFTASGNSEAQVHPYENAVVMIGDVIAAATLRSPTSVAALRPGATPVIIVPNPGTVLVAFAEDPASVVTLANVLVRVLEQEDRSVSLMPLIASNGTWAPFVWPAEAAGAVAAATQIWNERQYGVALPAVQENLARASADTVVGTFTLATNPHGERVTYTSLTQSTNAVIPAVDWVGVVLLDGRTQMVAFTQLLAAGGILEQVPAIVPPYYRVVRFPAEFLTA